MHREDELCNTIYINQDVGAISILPQYNLQGVYCCGSLLIWKRLQKSHWTPVNMTEYVIEKYDTFNTNGSPEELVFCGFHNQPIPYNYSDLTNNYDDNGTSIYASLMEN